MGNTPSPAPEQRGPRQAPGRMPCLTPALSFPLLSRVPPRSVTGAPSPSPVCRELQSSTSPATPEGPTSGGAPRRMMYVRGCRAARGWAGEDRVAREVAPLGAEAEPPALGVLCGRAGGWTGQRPCAGRGGAVERETAPQPQVGQVWSQVCLESGSDLPWGSSGKVSRGRGRLHGGLGLSWGWTGQVGVREGHVLRWHAPRAECREV